jgi:primosomal protein N' (replication factor Y) (superfamily II helicase)
MSAPILLIHCRRGSFQLTWCKNCRYKWECDHCSANLVSYRESKFSNLMYLLCHQCQSTYTYPKTCPKCQTLAEIESNYGGVEELEVQLKQQFKNTEIIRLDEIKLKDWEKDIDHKGEIFNNNSRQIFLTTRIFDPMIDYTVFQKIIFLQADFLQASTDFAVAEEVNKQLAELFIQAMNSETEVIFESALDSEENEFFKSLSQIKDPIEWFKAEIVNESSSRQMFKFPPFCNLILVTASEKTEKQANEKLTSLIGYLDTLKSDFQEVTYSKPYKAKFIKRKGLYSCHVLIKYPRAYSKFLDYKAKIAPYIANLRLQARINPRNTF